MLLSSNHLCQEVGNNGIFSGLSVLCVYHKLIMGYPHFIQCPQYANHPVHTNVITTHNWSGQALHGQW